MSKRPAPKKPPPRMVGEGGRGNYIAPRCPACGEYPGGEGAQTCQHCGEYVYAEAHWENEPKSFFARLFGG